MLAFVLTFVIDLLSITPMLYMMNTMDRVLSSRSGVTLVSLTLLVIAFYVFWSALDWIRSRLMIRLSLRIDWELASHVFDASFRRYVGRKNINVHQLLGDLLSLRQFFTGQSALTLMDAPFAVIFIFIGALFHPYLAVFGSAARNHDFDTEHSDADFLVEFSPEAPADLHRFLSIKSELESLLGRGVDLVEPEAVRNPFVLASINQHREAIYAS